ncbi:ABC transporter ATP-binding protein [Streptomyces sp. NPDC006879]|uniref:ABC transporter ATP-binding protein n=1 Tax=Streptomyces sp. NPDC006879 TaxID=3364767 RepID=UPI00367EE62F
MVSPPDNDVLWARSLHYSHRTTPALTGMSINARAGEILAVVGPRGSGKTTLLRCLSGQLLPDQGEVWFNSLPVHSMNALSRERLRRDRFGWIGSEPHLVPELNVWENAALPLLLSGTTHRKARRIAGAWLDRLDIGALARRRPQSLTQADRQRVSLARALAPLPAVIFADEPTAPLHRADGAQLLRTLTTAARSHSITVILSSHEEEATSQADRTVQVVDGHRAGPPSGQPGELEGQAACSLSV